MEKIGCNYKDEKIGQNSGIDQVLEPRTATRRK